MRNINLDNPYWLLLLIPLLLGVLIPFFIAIRKENKSTGTVVSLFIHILIVVLVAFGAAGVSTVTVMTETEIVVVADVSHSSKANADDIDRYIAEMKESVPETTKLSVVCFGKDHVLHTRFGEDIKSVKEAKVDGSATDIASAVEYASTLFHDDVLKRVVLLTDGSETVSEDVSGMIAAVERLVADDIAIDAIYLDSNIKEGTKEIQLTGVDYVGATYLNHDTTADILIQSNTDTLATLSVYCDGQKIFERTVELTRGYNIENYTLPTSVGGTFDYEVRIEATEEGGDSSEHNNSYSFTQRVATDIKVLMVTSNEDDIAAAKNIYGENAFLDVAYIPEDYRDHIKAVEKYKGDAKINVLPDMNVLPCSVEELCAYDEFLLTSIDIRNINNVSAFVGSLEVVVSQYGKSLVTAGDTKMQNKTDETLESLEDMLPVKFGNAAQDSKLFVIVIDVSRSMYQAGRFAVAKQAAVSLINLLSDEDKVAVVTFAGDISIVQPTTSAKNRQSIARKINDLQPQQGTSIGGGLKAAMDHMIAQDIDQKQVVLISDGMNYSSEIVEIEGDKMNAVQVASYMGKKDITISTMDPYNRNDADESAGTKTLQNIAKESGGKYYRIENEGSLEELVASDMADDLTESVVNKESTVHIELKKDDVMNGISYLPSVMGYVHSKAKVSADTVLSVEYTKKSGDVVRVPLYTHWKYGNGKVACFTSTLSGDWASNWQGSAPQKFLGNVTTVNVPEEKVDYPYTLDVRYDGIYSNVEIIPAILDPYATVDVTITSPSGVSVTEQLAFDASRYFYRFETNELGEYGIKVVYTTRVGVFESESSFHISYSPEYDSFANFDASDLYASIRHRGDVVEGKLPVLDDFDADVSTHRVMFTIPLLAAAVALYVVDVIIRKIRWTDIKSLFVKKAGRAKG